MHAPAVVSTGAAGRRRSGPGRARRAALALAAGLAVVAAAGGLSAPGWALVPDEHGYWWRLNGGGLGGVAPPVPDGGLWVASDPLGPQAVSALRVAVPVGHVVRSVVLNEDSRIGEPALVACPVTGPWTAPDPPPGRWEDRPSVDCQRAVAGQPGDDGERWVFDVGGLESDGVLDVAIMPAPDTDFSVTFAPPDEGTVVTVAAAPQPPAAPPVSAPPTEPAVPPAPRPPTSAPVPVAGPPTPRVGGPVATTAPVAPTTSSPPAPAVAAPPAPTRPAADGGGDRHPVVVVPVAAALAGWWWRYRHARRAAATHPLAVSPLTTAVPGVDRLTVGGAT